MPGTAALLSVLIKEDGRPFNPILKETVAGVERLDERLDERLINGACQSMTYKYMYDQNMIYMTFKR